MIRPLDALYAAGLALTAPVWGFNLLRTGKWRSDWKGRRGHAPRLPDSDRPTVLLHGVSVGEIVAVEPLVRRLAAEGCRVVISTTTNTGTDRARALFGDEHEVVRFPLDFSWMVERFLDRVRPDAVGLLELEVWPNFMRGCASREIPVAVVNGRLSESSMRGYTRLRRFVGPVFRQLAAVGVQTEAYAARFREMGVSWERVEVTGTMKWDVPIPDDLLARAERMRAELHLPRDRTTVVAISTGPDEEAGLLDAVPDEVTLVVVPRKPERFEEVAALAAWRRRTRSGKGSAEPEADGMAEPAGPAPRLLIDTMGEAEVVTALADLVVVGRTFNGMGGSNPIPAAQLGKPIAVGPDHQNFADVVAALTGRNAPAPVSDDGTDAESGRIAESAAEPASAPSWTPPLERPAAARVIERLADLRALLSDPHALERMAAAGPGIVAAQQGATEHNARLILRLLAETAAPGGHSPPNPQ